MDEAIIVGLSGRLNQKTVLLLATSRQVGGFLLYFCSENYILMASFGQRLTEARKMKGLSQEQLGEISGIDKHIISRYETDKTVPSVDVAKKLADALQVSLDFLTELEYSLFIDDSELTRLLKDYTLFKDEDKSTVKRFLTAFSFYSKIEETQLKLAL